MWLLEDTQSLLTRRLVPVPLSLRGSPSSSAERTQPLGSSTGAASLLARPLPSPAPQSLRQTQDGTLETHLDLVAKWVLTNRVKRLPGRTPTFRHTPGHPSHQPAHLDPFPPGGPHSSSLGAAGPLQAEGWPRASQHLQTSEAGRRGPRLRRGQGTVKRALLAASCLL